MKIYKDGITRTIEEKEWSEFERLGFVKVEEVKEIVEEKPKKKAK